MADPFTQILRFQVKPDKLEAFEAMAASTKAQQEQLPGCISVRYMKRFYTFDRVR